MTENFGSIAAMVIAAMIIAAITYMFKITIGTKTYLSTTTCARIICTVTNNFMNY